MVDAAIARGHALIAALPSSATWLAERIAGGDPSECAAAAHSQHRSLTKWRQQHHQGKARQRASQQENDMLRPSRETPIAELPHHLRPLARAVDRLPAAELHSAGDRNDAVSPEEAFKARYYRDRFAVELGGASPAELHELEDAVTRNAARSLPEMAMNSAIKGVLVVLAPFAIALEALKVLRG